MVSGRSLEAATALITGAFGAAGVESGTFPFIIGLVILAGSLFNLVQGWLQARAVILGPAELKRLAILFVPAAVFVGVIPLIGMVPASALYVFGAIAWQKRGSLLLAAVAAAGTGLALYLIFEKTFQISLPRGVLGTMLGF